MAYKQTLILLLLYSACLVLGVVAVSCFYAYGRELVLSVGSNDKSLLFWYLPILFIGIFAAQGAFACAMIGRRKSRKH